MIFDTTTREKRVLALLAVFAAAAFWAYLAFAG